MLLFCPSCSNMLTISRAKYDAVDRMTTDDDDEENGMEQQPAQGDHRFECRTCPYQYTLTQTVYEKKPFPRKKVEDVVGGADSFQHMAKVEAVCKNDKCDSTEAMFWQAQIRSADEPMTSFYACTKCLRRWQEN